MQQVGNERLLGPGVFRVGIVGEAPDKDMVETAVSVARTLRGLATYRIVACTDFHKDTGYAISEAATDLGGFLVAFDTVPFGKRDRARPFLYLAQTGITDDSQGGLYCWESSIDGKSVDTINIRHIIAENCGLLVIVSPYTTISQWYLQNYPSKCAVLHPEVIVGTHHVDSLDTLIRLIIKTARE